MAGIQIENNTFYRKDNIGATGIIQVSPHFPDAALGQTNTTISLKGGTNMNTWLVSGQVSESPKFGTNTLKGGNLILYGNDVDLTETAGVPRVKLYKMKQEYNYTEGGMAAGNTGKNLAVFTAFSNPDHYTYEENFDGAEKTIGDVVIIANEGSTNLRHEGAHVRQSNWGELLGHMANGTSLKSSSYALAGGSLGNDGILKKFFGTGVSGNKLYESSLGSKYYAGDDQQPLQYWHKDISDAVFLQPVNSSKKEGEWRPSNDFRGSMMDESGVAVIVPYFLYKDIKHLFEYTHTEVLSDTEEAAEPTSNTTIFDEGLIYTTPDVNTFYGGGDDTGLPVTRSTLGLSSEKFAEGGQSLHMYHLWSYSEANTSTDGVADYFSVQKDFAPQYSCVGMMKVPFPQPIDHAFSADTGAGVPNAGDFRMNLPEVEIKFFIDELDTVPRVGSYVDNDQVGQFNQYGVLNTDGTTAATGSLVLSGAYWDRAGTGMNRTAKTLGRNFTITFANYPPEEGESLDAYIIRGMDDFYGGAGSDAGDQYDYGQKYIGGLTMYRDIGVDDATEEDNPTNVIAQPLQTRVSPIASTGNAVTTKLPHYTNRLLVFNSGSSGDNAAKMVCFGAQAGTNTDGTQKSGSGYEPCVNLSMDKWVTAKFVFDVLGVNSQHDSAARTAEHTTDRTGMCKVFFTEGYVSGSAQEGGEGSEDPFAYHADVPSLDLYFPIRQNDTSSSISWFADRKYWPNVMCIWATNYRNFSDKNTGTASETQLWGDGASGYTTNKVKFGLMGDIPVDVGADKQTSVFIDSITLNNFTNSVYNASAQAVMNSTSIPIKEYGVKSALTRPIDYNASSWQSNRLQDTLTNYYSPTYLLMGFDNDAPTALETVSTANTYLGNFLFNGFGTQGFSKMTRQGAATTQAFFSDNYTHATTLNRDYFGYWPQNFNQLSGNSDTIGYSDTYAAVDVMEFVGNGLAAQKMDATKFDAEPTEATATVGGWSFVGDGTTDSYAKLYTDAMTEKGFGHVILNTGGTFANPAGGTLTAGNWFKCEHPFVAAKITKIPQTNSAGEDFKTDDGRTFEVDNPTIFDLDLDTEYTIYVAGASGASANRIATSEYWGYDVYVSGTANYGGLGYPVHIAQALTADADDTKLYVQAGFVDANLNYFQNIPHLWMELDNGTSTEIVRIVEAHPDPIGIGAPVTANTLVLERGIGGTTPLVYAAWSAGTTDRGRFIKQVISAKGLTQIEKRKDNVITMEKDAGAVLTQENLPYLYVSPYKYWMWFQLWPGSNEQPYSKAGGSSAKSYTSILPCVSGSDALTTTGSTFNEENYTFITGNYATAGKMAAYAQTWDLLLGSGSAVEITDFGNGPYNEGDGTGGNLDMRPAYNNQICALNLSGMTTLGSDGNVAGQKVVTKFSLDTPLSEQEIKFYGNDYADAGSIYAADVKPYYLWSYDAPVGTVSNLNVKPTIDLLKPDFDLYSITDENLSSVEFSWDESISHTWYRMLMVDESGSSIPNKYHQARLHVPLNEEPTSPTSAPSCSFYNYARNATVGTGSVTVGSRCRADIEGANGYALRTKNAATTSTGYALITGGTDIDSNENQGFDGLTEFTFVIHFTSDGLIDPASPAIQHVFGQGPVDGDTSNAVTVSIDESSGLVSFTLVDSIPATHSLTSKTRVAFDGETPMCMIVTYQSGSEAGPSMQLFIDGVREDYIQDVTGSMDLSPNIYIGSEAAASPSVNTIFNGKIEEIILYEKCYYIPEDGGKYILNTADLLDQTASKKLTHNARLFVYDYHNIRGNSKDKVAQSHEVNWGTTI